MLCLASEEREVQTDIDFRVGAPGRQRQLAQEIQQVYRIGREALLKAFCHFEAKLVELAVEYSDAELRMRIRDNGCGIDPQILETGRGGHWFRFGWKWRRRSPGKVKGENAESQFGYQRRWPPTEIVSDLLFIIEGKLLELSLGHSE